ncbi:MAG: ABC transporter permease [Alphaproteobacteria bacterium]|nr:ABC transporter permease [Alphaproteobacteria bacterium]
MTKKFKNIFLAVLPALFFLGAWQWFVHGNQRLEFLFASPSLVAQAAWAEFGHATIWNDIFVTLGEAALGLLSGTILGTVAGLLLWGNGKIDKITRPYIVFFGSIPIFALAPMTIIWFGIGLASKVVMAGFAVFFISLLQAYEGAHAVARQYFGFARSIAAPNARVVWKIVVPGAIDWVIAGYKMNVGAALVGAFIGEFVSSEAGLGYYILKASALYDVPRVLFGILLISLLGIAMTSAAWLLQAWRKTGS